jgi:hypothetical protein
MAKQLATLAFSLEFHPNFRPTPSLSRCLIARKMNASGSDEGKLLYQKEMKSKQQAFFHNEVNSLVKRAL